MTGITGAFVAGMKAMAAAWGFIAMLAIPLMILAGIVGAFAYVFGDEKSDGEEAQDDAGSDIAEAADHAGSREAKQADDAARERRKAAQGVR